MAKKKKKTKKQKIRKSSISTLVQLCREFSPDSLLKVMAKEYKKYPSLSRSEAEHEYWIKVSRSSANLASGMEKWLNEMIDEEDDNA